MRKKTVVNEIYGGFLFLLLFFFITLQLSNKTGV